MLVTFRVMMEEKIDVEFVHFEVKRTSLNGIDEEDPSDVVTVQKLPKSTPLLGGVSHCCA